MTSLVLDSVFGLEPHHGRVSNCMGVGVIGSYWQIIYDLLQGMDYFEFVESFLGSNTLVTWHKKKTKGPWGAQIEGISPILL